MARGSARLAGLALIVAGVAYFGIEAELVEHHTGDAVIGVCLVVVLYHLAMTVEPAWILTAGIVSTMFAGHWDNLGLNSTIGPHRVLLATGALAVLLRAPPARDRPPLRLGAVHLALATALAYILVSAYVEGTLGDSNAQVALLDTFGVVPFALFVIAPLAFYTRRQRLILLGGLVAAGAYLSMTAVLEKLKLYDLVVPSYIGDPAVGSHFGRARGPFAEAAANGVALFVCAAAAAVALVVWRGRLPRLAAAAVVVAAPVAVLLTLTRGAWLAASAGTFVALATSAGTRRYLPVAAAGGTVAVLLALAVIPDVADEARNRQDDKSPIYERQNTTAAGLRMVADRPFVGFGWWFENQEMEPYYRMDPNIPLTGAKAGLHNVYLLYAVGLGIVGLGLWALAVAGAFGGALAGRAPPELVPWKIGLKAAIVAWLVVGIFGPANYAFPTAAVWTWAGIMWGALSPAPAVAPVAREPARAPQPVAVGAR